MFLAQALIDAATGSGGRGGGGGGAGGAIVRGLGGLLEGKGGGGSSAGKAIGGLLSAAGGGGGGGGSAGRAIGGLLSAAGGGGSGGSAGRALGGLLSGGGGGKTAGNVLGLLGGLVNIISEAAAQYTPEPPPTPRSHFANVEANESEELRQFRRLFAQLAGDDMEVCPTELMNILNKVVARHQDLRSDGFSLDTCRSMVSVMDSDTTGKLDFYQFKYLWGNIKKWQCVFKQHVGPSGTLEMARIPAAFKAAGFNLHEQLYALIIRRYAEEDGTMDFNNFISCLVRLDGMFRAFKSLDRAGDGKVQMNLQDWLQLTMYS
ncbi:calpain small subunit 2 [Hemicordylus capensis]|uniref:calpain small subunit 2 n=1 Tax=Hemicordylus capensis TaxID=884348 RepID=UPI002302602B|nr:calpain small subunit 2 [Hemicordylus capensis]